jgi:CheY-like chemotaxis protein
MSEPARILIVDDDEAFAESNRDLLEAYGYEVRVAYDGQSGLAEARAFRPALMILDVMMATDTEGFEVARKIPETPELRGIKVLLVTGMTKEMRVRNRLQPDDTWLPVERVLEKPIGPQRLIAEVERILGKAE